MTTPLKIFDNRIDEWQVLDAYLLVQVLEPIKKVGSIIIPDDSTKEDTMCVGEILKMTRNAFLCSDGSKLRGAENVEVGDIVRFSKYAGELDKSQGSDTVLRTIQDSQVRYVMKKKDFEALEEKENV
jgi:co-chaperonin GroES (HSP10)